MQNHAIFLSYEVSLQPYLDGVDRVVPDAIFVGGRDPGPPANHLYSIGERRERETEQPEMPGFGELGISPQPVEEILRKMLTGFPRELA
jgi:hypothetical protein